MSERFKCVECGQNEVDCEGDLCDDCLEEYEEYEEEEDEE